MGLRQFTAGSPTKNYILYTNDGVDDGSASAPTGAAQYPTMFTGLNGTNYSGRRPPWNVAGADYRVGINTGSGLTDPNTISASIGTKSTGAAAGVSESDFALTILQDNVTLDGYDFTTGGNWVVINGGKSGLTIKNCNFKKLAVKVDTAGGLVTLLYNKFDGLGGSGETTFGALVILGAGVSVIAKYNWFKDAPNDFLDMGTADTLIAYNLFDTSSYESGAHGDALQFVGNGTANSFLVQFNTYVHNAPTVSGISSFIDFETQTSGATMNNPVVQNNVGICNFSGQVQGGAIFRVAQTAGAMVNPQLLNNYADPTSAFLSVSDGSAPGSYVKSGNIDLTTGASF